MAQYVLMRRIQRQNWFTRKIASRQPLAARIASSQPLLQGLLATEQTGKRTRQLAMPTARPVFLASPGDQESAEPGLFAMPDPLFEVQEPARETNATSALIENGQEAFFVFATGSREAQEKVVDATTTNKPENKREIEQYMIASGPEGVPDQQTTSGDQYLDVLSQEPAMADQLSGHLESKDLADPEIKMLPTEHDDVQQSPESDQSESEMSLIEHEQMYQSSTSEQPFEAILPQRQERVQARHPRGHIEEKSAELGHLPAVPPIPPSREKRQSKQKSANTEERDPETSATDELFAPRQDVDRSPQAWMARLRGLSNQNRGDSAGPAGDETIEQEAAQAQAAPPMPLSQRTSQFLRPLLGIDPASVRVYRDRRAEQLTEAYRADALTVGKDIAMAEDHPDDTPETLGLLAHELTHVARQQEPRFIPPIALAVDAPTGAGPVSSEDIKGTTEADRLAVPTDEEALAQRVERQVTRVAREQTDQAPFVPAENSSAQPGSVASSERWGGLPAPWEPLPAWLTSSTTMIDGDTHASQTQPPSSSPTVLASLESGTEKLAISAPDSITRAAGVQRTGVERSQVEEQQHTAPASTSGDAKAPEPEPDLDALARQVYSLLKRRLGVESRRGS